MTESAVSTVRLTSKAGEDELFELFEVAGAGAMGTVYRARERATGRQVAVKVLGNDADQARFGLEINVLSRLASPGIVAFLGHGLTSDGRNFLVMEWLEGETLSAKLASGPLPLREALRIGRVVAAALGDAHSAGIVHRDIKPNNVFILPSGEVKVLDFGIARLNELAGELTRTGQVVGTPGYMAPEQARGDRLIDARADLFSLGCLLFRCITNRRPFEGPDVLSTLSRLANDPAPHLQGVPASLDRLLQDLLAKDPAARPANAANVVARLDEVLADLETMPPSSELPCALPPAEPTMRSSPKPRKRRARRVLVIVGALLALLVLGVVGLQALARRERAAFVGRSCRELSGLIASRQTPSGGFHGEAHGTPSGWDTGQQLSALSYASARCAAVDAVTLDKAAAALDGLETPEGWKGNGTGPSVPATAWATLALALHALGGSPEAKAHALAARSRLLAWQQADGGFPYDHRIAEGQVYATMLAAWALVEARPLDADAEPEKRAVSWLRRALDEQALEPGLDEEVTWVLLRARHAGDAQVDDGPRLGRAAKRIIERCGLTGSTCSKPVYEDGRVRVDEKHSIVLLWHPWMMLTARTLAAEKILDGETSRALLRVATWGQREAQRSLELLGSEEEYKIAEYLLTISLWP